ncbi:unnamed protein product, partial [Ixodes hexagonus]
GVCKRVGSALCGYEVCVPLPDKDSFQCSCRRDGFYDAYDQKCKHWMSCEPNPCKLGDCLDQEGTKRRHCSCSSIPGLTTFCNINTEAKLKCEEYGATPRLTEEGKVVCVCGPGMKRINKICVPVSCLNFSMTCEELCQKNLLDKDDRCCQGWETSNCLKKPEGNKACEPGYVLKDGSCTDACTAKVADPVCPDGCNASANGRPFECKCKAGSQLADDGLTCNEEKTACTKEERNGCRYDQICRMRDSKPKCICPFPQAEKDGVCTSRCYNRRCEGRFRHCRLLSNGEESCRCLSPLKEISSKNYACALVDYSYVLQFQTNDSSPYSVEVCESRESDIRNAASTLSLSSTALFGKELVKFEQLGCSEKFVGRLVFSKKQDPAVLKRIETCQYRSGPVCIIPPRLYLKQTSIKPIEEEDLCQEFFQEQLDATNGTHVCRKDGDNYLLQCRDGLFGYDKVTSGRLTRWSCTGQSKHETIARSASRQNTVTSEAKVGEHWDAATTVPLASALTEKEPGVSTEQPATKDTPVPGDPCSANPCLNGGVCKPGLQEKFTCE